MMISPEFDNIESLRWIDEHCQRSIKHHNVLIDTWTRIGNHEQSEAHLVQFKDLIQLSKQINTRIVELAKKESENVQ